MAESITLLQIFYHLLLYVLLVNGGGFVLCYGENRAFHLPKFEWGDQRQVPTCFSQKPRGEKGAAVLEIRHHDDCYKTYKDWNQKVEETLIADNLRVQSLQWRMKNGAPSQIENSAQVQIPVTSGIKLQTLNYIAKVQLSRKTLLVVVDTGSDLTWVQCEPCKSCYSQQDPLFDPSMSTSYQSILCNSTACDFLRVSTGIPGVCGLDKPTCNYLVSYGDGSYTRGELAREQLFLGNTTIENFIFGCGRNNRGLFGGTVGLMGLGRNQLSLVSQTMEQFDGIFSYCLPSATLDASGSLVFGGDLSIFKNSTPISYTRMLAKPQLSSTFYFLNLTGMSVGGVKLQASGFVNGGALLDSGTVISRLPPSVYISVKQEFLKQFTGFPSSPAYSILDTCFNLSKYEEVNIPTLQLHFEGEIKVNVDVNGVFYFAQKDATQVCLALASLSSEDEVPIIGNFQQRNLRVIYDTKDNKVGFAEESCSFS